MSRFVVPALLFIFTLFPQSAVLGQDQDWALKMFDAKEHDFGVVARGADVEHQFVIKNIYKQPVHISNVRTSCGCTIATTPEKTTLDSLETTEVKVAIDTKRFMHQKNTKVIVTFDRPLYAQVELPIAVYIRTDVVLTPGSIDFGRVELGTGGKKEIDIAYAGRSDWKISGVELEHDHLTAEVTEKSRQQGSANYVLSVSAPNDIPVGEFRGRAFLLTDDAKNPKIPVLIEGLVEPDIVVKPSLVSLGRLTPGVSKRFNVIVRGKRPFEIEKIECDSTEPAFSMLPSKGEKTVHVLPITMTPPSETGKFEEEFFISVVDREDPVKFSVYGEIQ